MVNQITGSPVPVDAGLSFNYANWTAETVLSFVNVPWNNDYRDVVHFPGANAAARRAALNAYIDSRETAVGTIDNSRYAPTNRPIRVAIPFNSAYRFNYLRVHNPLMPIDGDMQRDFYYFIVDVRYITPGTTEIVVQLDVFQTFMYDATLGRCYIERGHIGIANENAFDNYGRDFLSIPEGLDIGGEYRTVDTRKETIMRPESGQYNVLVASTVSLDDYAGTAELGPVMVTAKGGMFSGLPSGAEYYVFPDTIAFRYFMAAYADRPWVTNGIISITLIPPITRYWPGFSFSGSSYSGGVKAPEGRPKSVKRSMWNNWRDDIVSHIPLRHRHLKKLLTYPYMVIEATTWSATPLVLKPESWSADNADYIERPALIPPNQRIAFVPQGYNRNSESALPDNSGTYGPGDDGGDYLDMQTLISNFPTMALVNNQAVSYMASNRASIAYQHSSADWAQQRALRGNETSYDQASSGISTANRLNEVGRMGDQMSTALGNQKMWQDTALQGVRTAMGDLDHGFAAVPQIALGMAQASQNAGAADAQLANRNATANSQTRAGVENNSFVRDTNKALSDWAAKGDYENSIAGINAKVQDAKLIQPTTSGQVGGESMNLVSDTVEISFRWKMLDPGMLRSIGDHWLRYGYAVRRFGEIPASLMVMSKFTYWKLTETYISSAAMPETFKQALRGLFEKGVTVYDDPANIGIVDIADNAVLTGIAL